MRRMYSEKQLENIASQTILNEVQDETSDLYSAIFEDATVIDLGEYINTAFAKSNTIYAKLIIKRDMLEIILSGQFIAGASAGNNTTILSNFGAAIPDEVRAKIYRADGTNLTEAPTTSDFKNTVVCMGLICKRVGSSLSSSSMFTFTSDNNANAYINGFALGTIAEDTDCILDIRFSLNL